MGWASSSWTSFIGCAVVVTDWFPSSVQLQKAFKRRKIQLCDLHHDDEIMVTVSNSTHPLVPSPHSSLLLLLLLLLLLQALDKLRSDSKLVSSKTSKHLMQLWSKNLHHPTLKIHSMCPKLSCCCLLLLLQHLPHCRLQWRRKVFESEPHVSHLVIRRNFF